MSSSLLCPGPASILASPASARHKPTLVQQPPRYVLVTGSGRGIGLAVSEALLRISCAASPVAVIVATRGMERSAAVAAALREAVPAPEVYALELDVADAASRAAAPCRVRALVGAGGRLAALVHNAGVAYDLPWSPPAPEGGEAEATRQTLDTNFLGPVDLTRRLAAAGLLCAGSRVVSVSSGGGHTALGKVSPDVRARFLAADLCTDDLVAMAQEFVADAAQGGKAELERQWNYSHSYGFSKLCLTQAVRTLALEHPDLIVHACTPGFVLTGMTQGSSAARTPEQGAEVITYLVLSDDIAVAHSGKFFNHEREILAWDCAS